MEIINHLIYGLLIAISVSTVRNIKSYQNFLKILKLWRKPLNCSLCLGFWTGFSYFIVTDINFGLALMLAFYTAFLAEEIEKTQNKLF